jgi:hypothetical protein
MYNVQPAQPAQGLQPASPSGFPGGATPQLGPASLPASTAVQPAIRTDNRTVTIRDMNGAPVGSGPRSAMPAVQPQITAALSARAGNPPTLQPVVMPAQTGLRPATMSNGQQGNTMGLQPAYLPGVPLATQQANRVQAYNNSPGPARYAASQTPVSTDPANPDPNASLRPGGMSPVAPAVAPANPGQSPIGLQPVQGPSALDQAQAKLTQMTNSGSGVSQIQNPFLRGLARVGDVAGSILAPGVAAAIPGTTLHHQQLLGQQQGIVSNDQAQLQAAAQRANTLSQMNERDAMGRRYDAQANLYNPEPMSAGQAQALGHPEWEGLKLDARDAERLVGGAARNDTTLQTHFGGQQRKLSADDAAAIGTPSLEGASMSNDEYQRLLQGTQHNQQWDTNNQRTTGQSDTNNRRNNSTRLTAQGMRDDTSAANSDRAHPGNGASKPIPAGVRDRIESQKATAINKARGQFDSGESSQDEYLDNWQQAQNEYEERIEAQTGSPVQHLDIRSNVDSKGNWIGQPTARPQPQSTPSGFVTRKGNRVALGDRVTVGGRSGLVVGFNARTGKAQMQWDAKE